MCCGSRRAAWRGAAPVAHRAPSAPSPASPGPAAPAGPGTQAAFPTVPVRYGEAAEVCVRGPATGRAYRFSAAEPLQAVDARDAAILLRGTAFQPA